MLPSPDADPQVSQRRKLPTRRKLPPRGGAGRGRTRARLRRPGCCSGRRGSRGAPGRAESWPRPRRLLHVTTSPNVPHGMYGRASRMTAPQRRASNGRCRASNGRCRASNGRCRASNGRCRAFATFEEPIERLQLVRVKHPAAEAMKARRAAARAEVQRTVLRRAATAFRRCNGASCPLRCVLLTQCEIQQPSPCKMQRANQSVQRATYDMQRATQRATRCNRQETTATMQRDPLQQRNLLQRDLLFAARASPK